MSWIVWMLLGCQTVSEGDPCSQDEDCGDGMICYIYDAESADAWVEGSPGVCELEEAPDTGQ